MNPFDFVKEISFGKEDIMRGTANDELAEKSYNQFVVTRALSYHSDTIFFSNEMNTRDLDNRLHFTYLLHSVPKKKRFGSKWHKAENTEDIELIMKEFKYSRSKAIDALKLLSHEEIAVIKQSYFKGGKDE